MGKKQCQSKWNSSQAIKSAIILKYWFLNDSKKISIQHTSDVYFIDNLYARS